MVLLLIVIVIIVEGNGFFVETWFGYIAVNGESPFYGNCETTGFFFAKRDLNRYCFSSFKKNYPVRVSKQDYVWKYDCD